MHCLYFICERKFYATTHVKITRHWKSTLIEAHCEKKSEHTRVSRAVGVRSRARKKILLYSGEAVLRGPNITRKPGIKHISGRTNLYSANTSIKWTLGKASCKCVNLVQVSLSSTAREVGGTEEINVF